MNNFINVQEPVQLNRTCNNNSIIHLHNVLRSTYCSTHVYLKDLRSFIIDTFENIKYPDVGRQY